MIPTIVKHLHYITEEKNVGPAVNHLLKFDTLGFDTETFHSRDKNIKAFDPTDGARMRLAQFATPEGRAFVFDLFKVSKTFLYMLFPNPFLCVGQNLKFDLKFLMYELGLDEFGELFDTFEAGQLIARGAVSGPGQWQFGLDDLVSRELNIDLPKDEQASEWYRPELSKQQIDYAARDALIVLPLYERQRDKLKRDRQVRVAQLEFNCLPALADIELNGMMLDKDMWAKQYKATENKIQSIKQTLWNEFGTQGTLFDSISSINLDATAQVIGAFKRKGLPVPLDPKTGKDSLNAKLLAPYLPDYPIIKTYTEYKIMAKQLSSYGLDWIDMCNPMDGRIHANYKSIGAETGRMSCSKPNLQQVPKENEYRNCLVAAPGWVIVGYDYSQMELRILAEYCRDPNFLRAFDEGYDLHRFTASLIFQCGMDAVTGKQRDIAKNLNFGIVYGIGVLKFATDAGIPLLEAKRIMDYYLEQAYPGMKRWLDNEGRQVLTSMTAVTMTGRIREYVVPFGLDEDTLKGTMAKIQRNAKNLPIQGTSVDITKRALHLTFEAIRPYRKGIKLVHVVHDEILLEALPMYVDKAKQILESCMLRAEREYLKRVPCVVDGSVTLCWTKKATDDQLKEAQDLLQGVIQI